MPTIEHAVADMQAGNYAAAIETFTPFALDGDVQAMQSIGGMYHFGNTHFDPDPSKAYTWYFLAAEHGNLTAFNNLGVLYRDGLAVKRDPALAFALFAHVSSAETATDDDYSRSRLNMSVVEMLITTNQYENSRQLFEAGITTQMLKQYQAPLRHMVYTR